MSNTEPVKVSMNLAEMTLEQLVQLSQGFGHEIERLRDKRAYLRKCIDNRLAQGERTSIELAPPQADAQAPGAELDVKQG